MHICICSQTYFGVCFKYITLSLKMKEKFIEVRNVALIQVFD